MPQRFASRSIPIATPALSAGVAATPFGPALVAVCGDSLAYLGFIGSRGQPAAWQELRENRQHSRITRDPMVARHWVDLVFSKSANISIPTHLTGTPFQQLVWRALQNIPRGQTRTYGEIAAAIQRPSAVRAVGCAVAANRIAVVIPCHRVVAASGGLGNFRWGGDLKQKLLCEEGVVFVHSQLAPDYSGGKVC